MEDVLSLSDDELEYRFLIAHSNIQRLLETLDHDDTGPSSPPAAKHIIENLPDVTTENNDECIICLKKFSDGEIAKKLPCSHLFDKECIVRWLQKTNTCPICRQEMPTDNEEYEKIRREKLRAKQREADLEILHHSMYS